MSSNQKAPIEREAAPSRPIDLSELRAKLAGTQGQTYWRSLEELSATPEFREMLHREFPDGASEWWDGVSRRNFLKLAAASMALAGLTACTKQPTQAIYPYVNQPPDLVLGEPLFYATSMPMGGYATGALVKSREGHPIKVDGNPDHPASLGGSSVWLQASILDLYDPDRSQAVLHNGEISSWSSFLADLNSVIVGQLARQGAGLRFLTETVTSPTLAAQLEALLKRYPQAKWHQYEPVTRDYVREGSILAFGETVETQYQFDAAATILSLESDFLYAHPDRLRHARQFTDGRRISSGRKEMNRLYAVESSPSVTGAMADHRLPLASAKVEDFARLLAKKLGLPVETPSGSMPEVPGSWLDALVAELQSHRGSSIIVAGEWQSPFVHALTHLLNRHLGNVGKTLFYTASAEAQPVNQLQSLVELTEAMRSGTVEVLFILGGNPAYTAPCDLEFRSLLSKTNLSIHLGLELDETAGECTWHIPSTHYLEAWGDARSLDGTVSLIQPLIAPLYDGKSAFELLGALIPEQPQFTDYEIVRNFWRSQNRWPDFELGWREALHNGLISNSASARKEPQIKEFDKTLRTNGTFAQLQTQNSARTVRPAGSDLSTTSQRNTSTAAAKPEPNGLDFSPASPRQPEAPAAGESGLEICFRPDCSVWDGRYANNGWLQECPKPLTKLTWDNAALISPALALRCGLASGDFIELVSSDRVLRAPVWVMPGQADKSVTLHLGYGRQRIGRVGTGVGFNAFLIRATHSPWLEQGARLVKKPGRHEFASTQTHHALDNPERQVFRSCHWDEFQTNPQVVKTSIEEPQPAETLYNPNEYPYKGYKWGMSIDLTTCIGCNACLVACETENNIPFVGKDQVRRNREMFWIRVDTYFQGSVDNPGFAHMPVPCMHCEHAPCELVCPVEATVHDQEGLNLQVYNRCVGTRFCSNNCPYKVRRFNFYQYTNYHQPSYKPMYNPEVTVRWRGVMEKCTYCIQRIAASRISAEKENRRIRHDEVKTACQQACPANAIVFGDLNGEKSQVLELKRSPLDYSMLGQLNTRPRTTYLAKVENPNSKASAV